MNDRLNKLLISLLFLQVSFVGPAFSTVEFAGQFLDIEIDQSFNLGNVSGNQDRSFMTQGFNYSTQVNARYEIPNFSFLNEGLEDWSFDSEATVRKTDDGQIDRRSDLHLLYLNAHLENPNFDFEFGDVYTELTNITFNRSLEGFKFYWNSEKTGTSINQFAGRVLLGEEGVQHTRYALGQRVEQELLKPFDGHEEWVFVQSVKAGASWSYTFDSGGSLANDAGLSDVNNLVWSIDLEAEFFKVLTSRIEIARSRLEDENDIRVVGDSHGKALKIENDLPVQTFLGYSNLSLDYERVDPQFTTESGSIAADREAVYAALSHRFNSRLSIDTSFREFHNNLEDTSGSTLRTKNPSFRINLKPFSSNFMFFRNIRVTSGYDFRENQNGSRTIDNHAHDVNVTISNELWGISHEARYTNRRIFDDASTSDQNAHLYGFRVGYDFNFENGYLSPYIDLTFRNEHSFGPSQRDRTQDINMGLSMGLFDRFYLNFSYGQNTVDRSVLGEDSNRESLSLSASYELSESIELSLTFDHRDSTFEDAEENFKEQIGEFRVIYRV